MELWKSYAIHLENREAELMNKVESLETEVRTLRTCGNCHWKNGELGKCFSCVSGSHWRLE